MTSALQLSAPEQSPERTPPDPEGPWWLGPSAIGPEGGAANPRAELASLREAGL